METLTQTSVPAPSAAEKHETIQWKMVQPRMGDKVLRFLTPCCNYEFLANDCPVKWNEFNKVVQCHNCGHVHAPSRHSWQAVDCPSCKGTGENTAGEDCGTCEGTGGQAVDTGCRDYHDEPRPYSGQAVDRQQEWTVESGGYGTYGIFPKYGEVVTYVSTRKQAELIVAAHNAALATERQRREQAEVGCASTSIPSNEKDIYQSRTSDQITKREQQGSTTRAKSNRTQPPIDNAFVEKGCEMFSPQSQIDYYKEQLLSAQEKLKKYESDQS